MIFGSGKQKKSKKQKKTCYCTKNKKYLQRINVKKIRYACHK